MKVQKLFSKKVSVKNLELSYFRQKNRLCRCITGFLLRNKGYLFSLVLVSQVDDGRAASYLRERSVPLFDLIVINKFVCDGGSDDSVSLCFCLCFDLQSFSFSFCVCDDGLLFRFSLKELLLSYLLFFDSVDISLGEVVVYYIYVSNVKSDLVELFVESVYKAFGDKASVCNAFLCCVALRTSFTAGVTSTVS